MTFLPGHDFVLHLLVVTDRPLQDLPPFDGGGLEHDLLAVIVPTPHVTEHELQAPYPLQRP